MVKNVFRIFQGQESPEKRVEKRKAQLRQAQQTYRERKERYVRELETQLAGARAREAGQQLEIQALRQAVQQLTTYIGQQGLEPPEHIWLPGETAQPYVRVQQPSPCAEIEYTHPSLDQKTTVSPVLPSGNHGNAPAEINQTLKSSNTRLGDQDLLGVGMEFVLLLESPCLFHLHGDPEKPGETGGHALTVSAQLASACPRGPNESLAPPEILRQKVPENIINSLLSLSSQLCAEHEVTPVQAWNRIRSQPYFGQIDTRIFWTLAQKLRDAAKCHGFGAVIDQGVFERLYFDTMGHT